MDVEELAGRVRQKVARQRRELEDDPRFRELRENERFLARLEAEMREAGPASQPARRRQPSAAPAADTSDEPQLKRLRAGEKGERIIALLGEHGRQSPKELRGRLRDEGIDPDGGTEVKRILWQLANQGNIVRHPEAGEYSLPESSQNGSTSQEGLQL